MYSAVTVLVDLEAGDICRHIVPIEQCYNTPIKYILESKWFLGWTKLAERG